MTRITRREFLLALSTGLGVLAIDPLLSSCSQKKPTPESLPAQPADISPTPAPTSLTQAVTAPAGASPDLAVARGGEPEEMLRRALKALGGIDRFVPRNADVIIKPNICTAYHTYEYAATTNPWVVGGLVRLCMEAGAKRVRVLDYPFGGTAEEAYVKSGIEEQVRLAGGEMTLMSKFKFVSSDIPKGKFIKKWDIFEDALNADVLINVPIAKHHNLARLTFGMKNLMGLIRNRQGIHVNLGQGLADLTSRIAPTLTVIDAVRILTNHGPTGGNLDDVKKLDTIIISPDIVAADSFACTLFDRHPSDLEYIQAAVAMGLGQSDLSKLKIEEIQVGG